MRRHGGPKSSSVGSRFGTLYRNTVSANNTRDGVFQLGKMSLGKKSASLEFHGLCGGKSSD